MCLDFDDLVECALCTACLYICCSCCMDKPRGQTTVIQQQPPIVYQPQQGQGGYPGGPYPQQGGYPQQQGGYPPQGFPPGGGYPPQGYPPQQFPQGQGYPPQAYQQEGPPQGMGYAPPPYNGGNPPYPPQQGYPQQPAYYPGGAQKY